MHHPRPHSRRWFLTAGTALPLLGACSSSLQTPAERTVASLPDDKARESLRTIERSTGGRIGVAAINLATGKRLAHRADERFAMCSTFKWLLGAVVLFRVEHGEERLNRPIQWSASDLVTYSPVTQPPVGNSPDGRATLSVGELCRATLRTSDNTAANLLLDTMGGPSGLTGYLRRFGDPVTRLDRYETELNQNAPGDPRDTSTPYAMLGLMQRLLFGDGLTPDSQTMLRDWMIANETGATRLRAGLPRGWTVGDRTGTSNNDANNNVAFAIAPGNHERNAGPLLVVSFIDAPNPMSKRTDAVHARVAGVVAGTLL